MANIEIKIRRVGSDAVPPQPMPGMDVGDTVKYTSDDGDVRVEFPAGHTPYDKAIVRKGETATVLHEGTFRCKCFIDLPGGGFVGWRADPSVSGADHVVPRH
jgi:hypothetical protein